MKTVSVHEAEDMVLGHDITQIIPGKTKGPAFRRGHIIKRDDIARLLDMGKENLYVFELTEGDLHEDEAARRIALATAGKNILLSEPREGKIELSAAMDGLIRINTRALYELNCYPEVMLATIHSNQRVKAGNVVAGTRIIPLVIAENKIRDLEESCRKYPSVVEILPFRSLKVGIVTTGNEVFSGRIEDGFGPVIRGKVRESGSEVMDQIFVSDSIDMISQSIHELIDKGADLITVTGGMSVDPDDVTPAGILKAGAEIITYGAPVLPGAMFLLAYLGTIPIMGLPGCVMYHKTSIFDLIYPIIQAGESINRKDIVMLAHGGLCVNCAECKYPNCGFGKGMTILSETKTHYERVDCTDLRH
jgi:molybdenum cofactor synthesis domain-containing protein